MADHLHTSPRLSYRGALVAALDLADPHSWIHFIDVQRQPPAELRCVGTDPQVYLAYPDALKRRLTEVTMEIVLESDTAGLLQVYWDLGDGVFAEQMEWFRITSGVADRQVITLTLPPGVVRLRIDPLDRPGRVVFHTVRFYEQHPEGASCFPFSALGTGGGQRRHWLDLPEMQQAISRRLMGDRLIDWPDWLFRELLDRPVKRCLHLGADDPAFGARAVGSGFVREYIGVFPPDAEPSAREYEARPGVRWQTADAALDTGTFDLVLSTGYWTRTASDDVTPARLASVVSADGVVVLLERFARADPLEERLVEQYVESCGYVLPAGWFQPRGVRTETETHGCDLDDRFVSKFDCVEVRPIGGTLIEPLFGRLPGEFFGLGTFTILGAIAGAYLLLEETLILTDVLSSRFNLVVAVPVGARRDRTRALASGWAVPVQGTFDRLRSPAAALPDRAGVAPLADDRREALLARLRAVDPVASLLAAPDPSTSSPGSWLDWKREQAAYHVRRLQRGIRSRLRGGIQTTRT